MSVIVENASISIKKILFATDFSATSHKAALYAKALALHFSSTVEIAHVFNPGKYLSSSEGIANLPENRRVCEEYLQDLCADFRLSEIAVRTALPEGYRPFAGLLKLARDEEVNLIVAGTGSKSAKERLVLGSTAEQLIRNAECAILTVGPKVTLPVDAPIAFKTIVCAADFSSEATKAAQYALSFAADSSAHLYFCYVRGLKADNSPKRQLLDTAFRSAIKKIVPEYFSDHCHPEFVVEHGNAAKAILELAARIRADLIVLGTRSASFWLTNLDQGVTPNLVAEARCPVLTVS
ncbi:universal stress protein [Edaphobacter paludis]|uniref:Universal stress protein n=1 Tax=Edaphobacter paludis TaxID=3035702 RepID=A0AAU7D1R0_9BACT